MEDPVGIPIAIQPHGAQIEYRLGARDRPAHAHLLHPVFDQMAARAFHDPGANRPTLGQIVVIAHGRLVAAIGAAGAQERFPLPLRAGGSSCLLLQRRDDVHRLALEQQHELGANPGRPFRMGFPQKGIHRIPQVFIRMHDVQNDGVLRKLRLHLILERLGPIDESDPMRDVRPIPLGRTLGQIYAGHGFTGQGRVLFLADGSGMRAYQGGIG